jgi:hypothetical protein
VVVVPAKVPRSPAALFVTTPAVANPLSVTEVLPVKVVNVPAAAVPPPIAPGAANVAPLSEEAFKLATFVVDEITNGAEPVETVEVNWPVVEIVVNAPVEGVVAPIAVPLIPVAVVLKLPEVTVKLFAPVLIEEAPSPDSAKAPEVPVKLIAPVVRVNPLLAVKSAAEVMVPEPVVEILPVVVKVPDVLIDQVAPPVRASVVPPVEVPIVIALALALSPK